MAILAAALLLGQGAPNWRDGQLHVVMCGTGSPLADPARASACVAIVTPKHFVLIDVGPGSWRKADLAGLPLADLDAVLLTHFHSDHLGDLGEALTMSWAAGRTKRLNVWGPPGVERVTAGFEMAYGADRGYRTAHHGADIMPGEAARPLAKAFDPGATVFRGDGDCGVRGAARSGAPGVWVPH